MFLGVVITYSRLASSNFPNFIEPPFRCFAKHPYNSISIMSPGGVLRSFVAQIASSSYFAVIKVNVSFVQARKCGHTSGE